MQTIEWETYEYEYKEKSPDWYWALGIIAAALAAVAVMLDNFLFAIVVIIGTVTLALLSIRKPDLLRCEISERGVSVNGELHSYAALKYFGIDEDAHPQKLILVSDRKFSQELILPLPEEWHKIREFLIQYVDEDSDLKESAVQKVMDYLGF
jgi:hypothetical protein